MIEPGGFHIEETDGNQSSESPDNALEQKATVSESLVTAYSKIAAELRLNPQVVFYPCCEFDASPAAAFPNARTIFLDLNERAMSTLTAAGYEAHVADALTYRPDTDIDLLILLNPQIPAGPVLDKVKIGGHVICNNYHSTAFQVKQDERYVPAAVALSAYYKDLRIDTQNASDYVTHVANDAEFEQHAQEIFLRAKTIVGETRSVLEAYNEFLQDGMLFWGKVLKNNAEYAPVPTKRPASVDDLFAFRRIA